MKARGCISRRVVVKAGIFVLLGAIVNIAVAWGCVFYRIQFRSGFARTFSVSPTSEQIGWWKANVSAAVEHEPSIEQLETLNGLDAEFMESRREEQSGPGACRWQSGLPLRSLGYQAWTQDRASRESQWESRGMLKTGTAFGRAALPVQPIWPGFAINTALYGGMLWLLVWTPGQLRGRLRVRRGQCPACGYDLRGADHEVCPECGSTCRRAAPET